MIRSCLATFCWSCHQLYGLGRFTHLIYKLCSCGRMNMWRGIKAAILCVCVRPLPCTHQGFSAQSPCVQYVHTLWSSQKKSWNGLTLMDPGASPIEVWMGECRAFYLTCPHDSCFPFCMPIGNLLAHEATLW